MSSKFLNWTVFILLCFIWGSSFILMKLSKQALNAPQIAGVRIFTAGIVFLPMAFFYFKKIPAGKKGTLFLTGILGNLIPALFFAAAIMKIDSSLTGILNSLTPLCVVILGAVFFKDKIARHKVMGVVIGFIGLCLLTLTQNNLNLSNFGYSLLVILAATSYGLNINIVSHYLKDIKPIHAASVSLASLTIPSGLILLQQDFLKLNWSDPIVHQSVLYASFLGLASSSLATVLFYFLVQRGGGLFASLVTYGIPFVALFWGILFGETISLASCLCLLIILLGVFLANRPDNKSALTVGPGVVEGVGK